MTRAPNRRWFRWSLRKMFSATAICAIAVNLHLAGEAVTHPASLWAIARLMVAGGLVAAGAAYLALSIRRVPVWNQWPAYVLWAVMAWGVLIVLGTSSILTGALLLNVFGY
jgi:uncharacterized membrane protein YqgA involved in biofilm formation